MNIMTKPTDHPVMPVIPACRVPFTAPPPSAHVIPPAPVVAMPDAEGQMVAAYEHSFYVIPHPKAVYAERELVRLAAFVAEQDARRPTLAASGGFAAPVALITKLHPKHRDFAAGKRWQAWVPLVDGAHRSVMSNALEKLLTVLNRL